MSGGDLTEEEAEFAAWAEGGIFDFLNPDAPASPAQETAWAAEQAVAALEQRYPSRTERLLVFAVVGARLVKARDELLDAILRAEYQWVKVTTAVGVPEWRALAWQPYQLDQLARVTGLTPQTVKKRARRVALLTLVEAMEAAGEDASEVKAKL